MSARALHRQGNSLPPAFDRPKRTSSANDNGINNTKEQCSFSHAHLGRIPDPLKELHHPQRGLTEAHGRTGSDIVSDIPHRYGRTALTAPSSPDPPLLR